MSNRLTTVRDALQRLLDASRAITAAHWPIGPLGQNFDKALAQADRALASTAFTAPIAFPCEVETRGGGKVTLVAQHGDELVGLIADPDAPRASTWNLDGSYFDAGDPDADDLVLPEVDPAPVGVPA